MTVTPTRERAELKPHQVRREEMEAWEHEQELGPSEGGRKGEVCVLKEYQYKVYKCRYANDLVVVFHNQNNLQQLQRRQPPYGSCDQSTRQGPSR